MTMAIQAPVGVPNGMLDGKRSRRVVAEVPPRRGCQATEHAASDGMQRADF